MSIGFFGVGVFHPKSEVNIGTLFRSAFSFDADFLFTVGRRYKPQSSDTTKAWRHIPLTHYDDIEDFLSHLPRECRLVGVELDDKAIPIAAFKHPEQACYLLGAEDSGIPPSVLARCHHAIRIPGTHCLNVAVAGSIVLFDRINKSGQ